MRDIKDILYEICEDKAVYETGVDLIEKGILDSYAIIEFLSVLEDEGIVIQITQIDRELLRTVEGIERLIRDCTDVG